MYILNQTIYIDTEDEFLIIILPQKDPIIIEKDIELIQNLMNLFLSPNAIEDAYSKIINNFSISKRKFNEIINDFLNLNILIKYEEVSFKSYGKFSRQLNLFSSINDSNFRKALDIQDKINDSTVLLLGMGGVGTYVSNSLVRMGVQDLIIIDYDIIENSNIARQSLYFEEDIGKLKVDVAEKMLKKINPSIRIKKFNYEILSESDFDEIFEQSKPDIIVCSADKPRGEIQLIIDRVSKKNNIPWITGGPFGLDKIFIGPLFVPGETRSYEEIFGLPNENKIIKKINNNSISTVIDPFNGMGALMLVTEIIKFLTGYERTCIKEACIILNTTDWSIEKHEL